MVQKEFRKHLKSLDPETRRKYLVWLLNTFKVDISLTQRVEGGGLYKYTNQEVCNKNAEKRTSGKNEIPLWKSVTKESEFESLLLNSKMPWAPRSGTTRELKHLMKMFKTLFRESRRGIFVSIRNGKMTHWIPFYKETFINEKISKLKSKYELKTDSVIDGCNIVRTRKTEHNFSTFCIYNNSNYGWVCLTKSQYSTQDIQVDC